MSDTLVGTYYDTEGRSADLYGDFRRGSLLAQRRSAEGAGGGLQEAPRWPQTSADVLRTRRSHGRTGWDPSIGMSVPRR